MICKAVKVLVAIYTANLKYTTEIERVVGYTSDRRKTTVVV